MEQNISIITKKLWRLMRVMFFMLKKEITKAKIMSDLNIMIKRGKIAGKQTSPCNEYEFSCKNTPRHPLALFSSHKRHKNNRHNLAASNPPLAIDYSDDIIINDVVLKALDILKSAATMSSPPLLESGSPLDEKMLITGSPSLVTKGGEDDRVDEAAEEFIRRFYNDRRRED